MNICPTCGRVVRARKCSLRGALLYTLAASAGAAETSLPFHTYSPASGGQSRLTASELCTARGVPRANAPELATPQPSESQPATPRTRKPR